MPEEPCPSQVTVPGVRIFSERRYRLVGSRAVPVDDDGGRARFDQYLATVATVTLVARVDGAPAGSQVDLAPRVNVLAMPSYVGLRAFSRHAFRVARAVAAATRTDELLVCRVPGLLSFVAAAICRLRRRPYVVEVRGDPGEVFRSGTLGRTGRMAAPAVAAVQRRVVRGSRGCWYVTERTLQAAYPAPPGVPVVGVSDVELEDGDYVAQSDGSRPAPTDAPPRPRLVAVGSQEQLYKGHDVLLDAVGRLRADGRSVDLQLVGAGRMQAELRAHADTLGLHDVDFTGQISDRAQLRRILDDATVFVMPSRTEGLPRALVEAMARGRPAVGSRVGGITELLDEEVLVPPGDPASLAGAVARVLDDDELAERLGRHNLERALRMRRRHTEPLQIAWLRAVTDRPSPRRVGHVLGSLDIGGCERLLQDIAERGASAADSPTMVVITLAGRRGVLAPRFVAAGAEVVECPLLPWPTFVPRLLRCLRRLDLDVLVSHVSLFSGVVTTIARLASITRRVAWFHTDGDYKPGGRPRLVFQAGLRALLRRNATRVVGVTWPALEFAAGSRDATSLPDPHVVPNGVDTARFTPADRSAARATLGLPGDGVVVLHVGRASPEKRRPFLLDVLQLLPADATMLLMSPGGDADLSGLPTTKRNDPRLRMLEGVEDVVPVLRAADVLVLPSNREGLPVSVLEALSVGLPVVAASVSGIRTLATQLAGIHVVAGDAGPQAWVGPVLAGAARAPAERDAIRASLCASPYAWDVAAAQWARVWTT